MALSPRTFGWRAMASAISERSVPRLFSLPYVSASDSLAKRKSTYGITSFSGSLKN